MAVDPVCNTPIQPHQAEGMIWYKGVPFYFCSEECKEAFDKHPKRYYRLAPLGRQ
jgi:YHS domain-containing protein